MASSGKRLERRKSSRQFWSGSEPAAAAAAMRRHAVRWCRLPSTRESRRRLREHATESRAADHHPGSPAHDRQAQYVLRVEALSDKPGSLHGRRDRWERTPRKTRAERKARSFPNRQPDAKRADDEHDRYQWRNAFPVHQRAPTRNRVRQNKQAAIPGQPGFSNDRAIRLLTTLRVIRGR